MKHTIPVVNLEKLLDKVKKLNRKAEKLNYEPIKIKEIEREIVEIKEDDTTYHVEYVTIEIIGNSPKLDNWQFVAVLQHSYEDGTIIRNITGEEVPTRFYNTKPVCEHCNTNRYRKDTYIVKNTVTGEYKQVGRSCLKDFTGHSNINTIASYYTELIELENEFMNNLICNINWDIDDRYYLIDEYLTYVVKEIRENGYTSKSNAGFDLSRTTCERAFNNMGYKRGEKDITEEDEEMVKDMLEWIRTKDITGMGEYWHNLQTICKSDYIGYRDMGFVASLPVTYKRELERARKQEKRQATSEFIGTIGDRKDFTLTVNKQIVIGTIYGAMYINIMEDEQGNVYKWATSKGTLEEGKTYKIKGTIKEHELYNQVKQTVLTRCKVLEEIN